MKLKKFLFSLFLSSFALTLSAQNSAKGSLFIIGGGERPPSLMQEMLSTAAMEKDDYAVVLPMASSIPDTVALFITAQINSLVPNEVQTFNFKKGEDISTARIDSLKNAQLIYITGGDQNKFMEVVRNTPIHTAIREAYHNGATIAGTSAGAAVMSKIMITGSQKSQKEYGDFEKIWYENAETEEGLGLLKNLIIDQHFIARSRYNRLISVMADYPELTCVGIDESTAIVVHGNEFRVVGESQVVVLSDPELTQGTNEKLVSFKEIRFSLLSHGDKFKMNNNQPSE